jgi:hypothetical protein
LGSAKVTVTPECGSRFSAVRTFRSGGGWQQQKSAGRAAMTIDAAGRIGVKSRIGRTIACRHRHECRNSGLAHPFRGLAGRTRRPPFA